jgi:hypothetical protein
MFSLKVSAMASKRPFPFVSNVRAIEKTRIKKKEYQKRARVVLGQSM